MTFRQLLDKAKDGITAKEIAGVTVAVTSTSGVTPSTTKADGSFKLTDVPPGTVEITFSGSNHATTVRTERPGVKANIHIDVSMLPYSALTGRVTDLTATPIAGATVTVKNADGTAFTGSAPVLTSRAGRT